MDFSSLRFFCTVLLTACLLSGCGRKGDPEIPGATPQAPNQTVTKPVVEDRPFLLDPVL